MKFLGICIIITAAILSGTLLYTNLRTDTTDRYKVAGAKVFDTQEGKFVDTSQPIETTLNKSYEIHVSIDEVNKLLDKKLKKEYLSSDERSILTGYYRTQLTTWAKQFNDDNNQGKISNFSKYDIERIESGKKPNGTYLKDKPYWYDDLPINGFMLKKYVFDE
jgi:DNA repair exonuclease SbcCD nuclease subunit